MTTKTQKTMILSLLAIAAISITSMSLDSVIAEDAIISFDKKSDPQQAVITKIDNSLENVGDSLYLEYAEKSLTDISLQEFGQNWNVVAVDYGGTAEPFEVTTISVILKMEDSPSNARQCEYETTAVIEYDAKTGKVLDKKLPSMEICEAPLTLERRTASANLPDFIPSATASSTRAYLTSEQGSDAGHYGGYGKMKVPDLDEVGTDNIYDDQDKFVGFSYNQVINDHLFQVGWVVSGKYYSNLGNADKYLVYADGSETANELPTVSWTDNTDATVYIQCGTADDYYVYMFHNNKWATHDSNYDCDNTTDDDINNGVFLENANTVSTNDWQDDITTDVKAWNMKEFETKTTVSNWNSASNTYEDCPSGTGSTTDISSTLGSGGTSVWTVSGIDDC